MYIPPRERAKHVSLNVFSDEAFPNILLGAWITSTIQYLVGIVPVSFSIVSFFAWIVSVFIYAYIDHIRQTIEEKKRETLSRDSDYWGIE